MRHTFTLRVGAIAGALLLLACMPWIERILPPMLACMPWIGRFLPSSWHLSALILPSIFAYALIGIGLNIITGFAGQLNLGVAAFVAIGAYAYAILTSNLYPFLLGFWSGLALATCAAALVGAALAIPTTRLRGDYLAIVTLGFCEIVQDLLKNLDPITKGTAGINPVQDPSLLGHDLAGGPGVYWLYLGIMLLGAWVARNLRWSRQGRQWVAVREDELAARACGVETARARLTAFTWGSAYAGAGGALLAALIGTSADPGNYDFQLSIMVLCAVIVGGMGSVGGVILGATLMFGLNSVVLEPLTRLIQGHGGRSVIAAPSNWKFLVFGLALILTMRLRPGGLWPARELRAPTAPPPPPSTPSTPSAPPSPEPPIPQPPRGLGLSGPLLEVRHLTLRFGGLVALDDVSFQVNAGEIVSVIGPNGAGKTSLFNAITALHPPTSGQVRLSGKPLARRLDLLAIARWLGNGLVTASFFGLGADVLGVWQAVVTNHYAFNQPFPLWAALTDGIAELGGSSLAHWAEAIGFALGVSGSISAWRRSRLVPDLVVRAGISRTFQNIRLFPALSVLDNVLVGMDAHLPADTAHAVVHSPIAARHARVAEADALALLARVGLAEAAHQPAGSLPYGHQRRLEIARALAARPKLILLDEPAAGMNPSEADALMRAIGAIRADGTAVLLIEHHMRVVMGISDRVVVLHYGHRIAEGTPAEVRADPKVIEAYLGTESA